MSFRDWLGTLPGLEQRSFIDNAYCPALGDEFDTLHKRSEKLAREKRVMEKHGVSVERHNGGPFDS